MSFLEFSFSFIIDLFTVCLANEAVTAIHQSGLEPATLRLIAKRSTNQMFQV